MVSYRYQQGEVTLVYLLSYVVGMRPDEFGLLPDFGGWIDVSDLVKVLQGDSFWCSVSQTIIRKILQRLAIEDFLELVGTKVRCLKYCPPLPEYGLVLPANLYYAVRRRACKFICEYGLAAPKSGNLILTIDPDKALFLGRRYDNKPILVTVQAHQAVIHGVIFVRWGEQWLCDWIPVSCLTSFSRK